MKTAEDTLSLQEWYDTARTMTLDDLPKFLETLMNSPDLDYSTLCHAFAAGAIGTLSAMDKHENGQITLYQANAIMMLFIKHWMYKANKVGFSIVDYDQLLYPQYEEEFDKTISQATWEKLQEEAKELIETYKEGDILDLISPNVYNHWQSIVDGVVPFGFGIK